jgi:RimJ/RimL family protein N-acetyltransferase
VTDRLLLRMYTPEDADGLFRAVNESRDTLLPWLPWVPTAHRTIYETIYDIERFRRDVDPWTERTNLVLGVFRRDTGEIVGGNGFHTLRLATSQAEIGYWTHERHRRQGYCTEATRWMISWMLTPRERALRGGDGCEVPGWGLRRVEILAAGGNVASCAVPRRIGLREEMRRVEHTWLDGAGWQDMLCWGVLAREWDFIRHAPAGR